MILMRLLVFIRVKNYFELGSTILYHHPFFKPFLNRLLSSVNYIATWLQIALFLIKIMKVHDMIVVVFNELTG